MLHMTKVYMSVKEAVKRYSLDALAAECYPFYSGEMNLPSSWLADEGIILDTEGDIGHTMVMYMLNLAAKGGATALGEVGSIDDKMSIFWRLLMKEVLPILWLSLWNRYRFLRVEREAVL